MIVPLAGATLLACRSDPAREQVTHEAVAEVERREPKADRVVVEVHLVPPRIRREHRFDAELLGLVIALIESGLADLEDVVPEVKSATVSPGLSRSLTKEILQFQGEIGMATRSERLEIKLNLCKSGPKPPGDCTLLEASGSLDVPSLPVSEILSGAASVLGRAPEAGTSTTWTAPQSVDRYALLLCGRAAASWYGFIPPPPPGDIGDRRRDPVERAIYLDPNMPIAQWIAGRRHITLNLPALAHAAFSRAASARPRSTLFLADAALALSAQGEASEALDTWQRVRQRRPNDPRFALQYVHALLAAGYADQARKSLDAIPQRYQTDGALVELRVAVEDAIGASPDREDLLVLWQEVAISDPEPVRRRIWQRIRSQRYREALDLTHELASRGAPTEASRLAVALGIAVRDFEAVEQEMLRLGMKEELSRLRARIAIERNPAFWPWQLATSSDPIAIVIRGDSLLASGRPEQAILEADRALQIEPWMPEALALRYASLVRLRRHRDALAALDALGASDPALRDEILARTPSPSGVAPSLASDTSQGLRTAPGKTATGTHAHPDSP